MIHKIIYKNYCMAITIFVFSMLIITVAEPLFSSDLSDASALRERCEKEVKILDVSVKNFGDNVDIEDFAKGEQLIKTGNVKFIQSKYPEAIENYNKYLAIQFKVYEVLANKYITGTAKLNDAAGEVLVDFIDNKKVVDYLRLASQNLNDAKSAMATKHYMQIIDVCRTAKKYALGAYKLAGKEIPDQFKKDAADIEGKIYK